MKMSEKEKSYYDGLKRAEGILVCYLLEQRSKPAVTNEAKARAWLTEEIMEDLRRRLQKEIKLQSWRGESRK